jgi:hypothetical protein
MAKGGPMRMLRSPRVIVSLGFAAALAGAVLASEKSAREMTDTGGKFVASLTPDQRMRATFPY